MLSPSKRLHGVSRQAFLGLWRRTTASQGHRQASAMAPRDPHSYADSSQPFVKHIDLEITVDFDQKVITGIANYSLGGAVFEGDIFLDTRDVIVNGAFDSHGKPLHFMLAEQADPIKGSQLTVKLEGKGSSFSLRFRSSPTASALQWLDPSQTSGGKLPFVYTQCQAIHARSIFPCQDTPAARFRYSARVDIPQEMKAVMSAGHISRYTHDDDPNIAPGRAVETFSMEQPIPPYLFALAVGDIAYQDLGPRSRVYAEPNMLEAAAYEFANTERMIEQAEALFGPYDWERFDLLVMPPSFPYGGMENPRMVFLTPTVIVGDRSGVEVVAHELAHSWTGNLITNSSANDFWLNEGFTTYAERRIVEVLDGEERVALHLGLGWKGLEDEVERFKDRPEFTRLKTNQENVDPDEIYSQVPYEKGCLFVRRLESQLGRPVFDKFLKSYITKFRFQSIDSETFLEFLREHFPDIDKQVDVHTWIYGEGIPQDATKPKSFILETVLKTVDNFPSSGGEGWQSYLKSLKETSKKWHAQEWQIFLETIPKKMDAEKLKDLDDAFNLSRHRNWELRVAFLVIAANSGYEACYPEIETALLNVGRMKFLRPLYSGLLDSTPKGKAFAKDVYAKARNKYHPIAQSVVEGLMSRHG